MPDHLRAQSALSRCPTGRRATLTALCLAAVLLCGNARPAFAEDLEWIGDQNAISSGGPPGWAFYEGTMWRGFAKPGDPDQSNHEDEDPANDDAYFGSGYLAPGQIWPHPYGAGGTIFFGDFGAVHAPFKGGPTSQPAVHATSRSLHVQHGEWVFDFGPYSFFHDVGNDSGSYTVSEGIFIGGNRLHGGAPGNAVLTVRNGVLAQDQVDNWAGMVVGGGFGNSGQLIIEGATSRVEIARDVWIGAAGGSGRIDVLNGAQLLARGVGTGAYHGPEGQLSTTTLNVHGHGSLVTSYSGLNHGSLSVTGGAILDSMRPDGIKHWAWLGIEEGAVGTAMVQGAGSRWINMDRLTIGGVYHTITNGTGHLTILDGGLVSSEMVVVANRGPSRGTATVSGVDTAWIVNHHLVVGDEGEAEVSVSNHATVSAGSVEVAASATSTAELTVSSNARMEIDHSMIVGNRGIGILNATFGADVTVGGRLHVGGAGGHGSLHLQSGATLVSRSAAVGDGFIAPDGSGSVSLTGSQTSWTVHEGLEVGLFNTGQLSLAGGAQLAVGGNIEVGRASTGHGTLTATTASSITSFGGIIGFEPGSQGMVSLSNGAEWTIEDRLFIGSNFGPEGGQGTLVAASNALVNIGNGLILGNEGLAVVNDGGRINIGSGELHAGGFIRVGGGGTLMGTGKILGNLLVSGGTVSPGFSPGGLEVDGDVTFDGDSTLFIEIGGLIPGVDYDQLAVTGDLTLGGFLVLRFVNGFRPQVGDTFDLFEVGGLFDDSSQPQLQALNAPNRFAADWGWGDGVLRVTVTAVPEPATWTLCALAALPLWAVSRRRRRGGQQAA